MLVKDCFSSRESLLQINDFTNNLLQSVSTTSDASAAGVAVPDTGSTTLDSVLTTEGAKVSGMLLGLKLLTLTTQRWTVTDTVLSCDSDLLSALSPIIERMLDTEWIVTITKAQTCRPFEKKLTWIMGMMVLTFLMYDVSRERVAKLW